ncbi:MAG: hypothetical protein JWQ49_3335 [Edaphobacter sp.]|nr:hypothetical protein [Edaphobacter sp.]
MRTIVLRLVSCSLLLSRISQEFRHLVGAVDLSAPLLVSALVAVRIHFWRKVGVLLSFDDGKSVA